MSLCRRQRPMFSSRYSASALQHPLVLSLALLVGVLVYHLVLAPPHPSTPHPAPEPYSNSQPSNPCSVFTPIWLALSAMWSINTYHTNVDSARDLHRMLGWVPLLELFHCILSLFYFMRCM